MEKMKRRIIVLDRTNPVTHGDFRVQFFFNFPLQSLLRGFTRLDFAARKLPLTLVVTITGRCQVLDNIFHK